MANSIDSVKKIQKEIDVIISQMKINQEQLIAISKLAREIADSFSRMKTPEDINNSLKTSRKNTDQLNASIREQNRLEKALIASKAKMELATESTNRALIKSRYEYQQQNKLIKEAAILSSKFSTELQKATVIRNRHARVIQDLNLKKALGVSLTNAETVSLNKATIAFKKYNEAIRGAKESVGRFQENVGNYPKGLLAAANAARSLGSALGFMGGAFLIVNTVRDALNRIKEFDKTMQNLSGILRTNRKDIKDLEEEIVSVAKSSVRTTNEVAKLAESLLTLGKTKNEIKDLISPVTDLSLAMNTSADEAGEFLVQMLNTFGASTDQAGKYADTIATIRTSTSLDFQRMRDSFQYLAPISRALGKDLAYTGSVIGILSDNGIKAERAGRLLGTAQQKLASEGKSLTDALNQLNKASEKNVSELKLLELASKLFGKQAASLGIILANNSGKIDENSEAIRRNNGALKDLVNEQLESLDSKLKLLDSAWEGLITTIDNGQGKMSTYIKESTTLFTGLLNAITAAEVASEGLAKANVNEGFLDYLQRLNPLLRFIETGYEKAEDAQISFDESNQRLSKRTLELVEAERDALKTRYLNTETTEEERKVILQQIRVLEKAIKTKKQERKDLVEQAKELGYLGQAYSSTGEEVENFYESAEQATVKELKMFIAAQKAKKNALKDGALDDDDDKKNKKRQRAVDLEIDLFQERNREIEIAKKSLEKLFEMYEKDKSFKLPEIDQESIDEFQSNLAKIIDVDIKKEDVEKKIRDGVKDIFNSIEDSFGVNADVLDDFFDKITERGEKSFEELADIAKSSLNVIGSVTDSIFQSKIDKYEEDIEANNEYYAGLLENEELTEEERKRLEDDRAAEEKRLQKEQKKEKEKAFLYNQALSVAEIGINLAKTISAINLAAAAQDAITPFAFGATGVAYRAANIPLAIASAAIQTGVVLAKTLPKFAEGGVMDHDGYMMINDHHSGRLEVVERGNQLLMTSKKNAVVKGEKGDIIHKDAKKYFEGVTDKDLISNLQYHTVMASIKSNERLVNVIENKRVKEANKFNSDQIVKAIKGQKTKVNINQSINIGEDLYFLSRLNNTL